MAGLIRIDHEPFSMSFFDGSLTYIESYLIEAYVKSFFYTGECVPVFYDLVGIFEDSLEMSGRRFFTSDVLEFPMELHEMTYEYVEEILYRHKIEFINMNGMHVNECQAMLFPEWSD